MVSRRTIRLELLAAAAVLWLAHGAATAAMFGACAAPVSLLPDPDTLSQREAGDAPVVVDADEGVYERENEAYIFTGDVLLRRADQTLQADRLRYHEPTHRVDVLGNVLIEDSSLSLSATEGYLYTQESRGRLADVHFRFKAGYSHGEAEQADLLDDSRSRFERVRFTACPPDDEDWWLDARDITLDRDEGFGTARNARVTFMGVPLFYTPYISFPIDDRRKTGFLPPRVGVSSENGLDLTLPYYINLAPDYDATLSPRILSQRGLMLGIEGRLLRPSFATQTQLFYLPGDREYGDDRWAANYDLLSRRQGPFYYGADLSRVSDDDYLDDFGNSLATVSESHLLSEAYAGYQRDRWQLTAQLQSWQNLDREIARINRPYRVLPRLNFGYRGVPVGDLLSYGLGTEFVNFEHPHDDLVDTGSRLDVMPTASLRYERLAYFVIPSLAVRHTQYQLDRWVSGAPEQLDRTLPVFSIDSGIFLEREFSLRGRGLLQTLEPRLFYLYVPYENQDELPLFDTTETEPSLGQLFSTNRFTGPDRVGDANQISLGLGTRVLDRETGREYLYAAIGQAFYLDDRRVQLTAGQPADTSDTSAVLAEARASASAMTAYVDYHWDPERNESGRSGLRLSYRPGEWQAINVGYRRRTELLGEPLEQTELSVVWPISQRWLGLAGWHYSLLENTTLERFAGFAYNSCCWTLRTVAREHVSQAGDEPSLSFMFQLELTGLGALGQPLDDFLLETISGFQFQR